MYNDALLTVLASLVASLIWLVKAMHTRSDKLIEQRDLEVTRALRALEASVDAFRRFEIQEHETHRSLIDRMDASMHTQSQILETLKRMTG